MCIIVDANTVGDLNRPTEHGAPVLKWLTNGRGGLVVGGEVMRELGQSPKMLNLMGELDRAGQLHRVRPAKVKAVSLKHKLKDVCRSNDSDVIAVALATGCRLIFSRDKDLHKDAQNREIMNPIASIYQTKDHTHLLTDCKCAGDQ